MLRVSAQRARPALLAALMLVVSPLPQSRAEEIQVPQWVPSVGVDVGFQSRRIDADVDALLFASRNQPTRRVPCFPVGSGDLEGFCNFSTEDDRAADGAVLGGSAQLMGPSLKSVFLRPRPFLQGGFEWAFDSRTVAESGLPVSSWPDNLAEPDMRVRMRSNPQYMWHIGGGVALQLPIELRPVWIKIGAHYMEEESEAIGTIQRGEDPDPTPVTAEFVDELTIRGVGPSLGVESEIARFGPIGVNIVGDVLMTFPLSGTDSTFQIDNPSRDGDPPRCVDSPPGTVRCTNPATFDYSADNLSWLGLVTLRFSWVGTD